MPTLVLLSGPAGSGKSTSAAAWAARGQGVRSAIDVDALRGLIKAGLASPEDGWTDETERQWRLGVDVASAMARVYHRHGVDCIIDVYAPPGPECMWQGLVDELRIHRVTLLPSLDICLERNEKRNRYPGLDEESVRANYEGLEWCVHEYNLPHVIDNGNLTVEETVDAIEATL